MMPKTIITKGRNAVPAFQYFKDELDLLVGFLKIVLKGRFNRRDRFDRRDPRTERWWGLYSMVDVYHSMSLRWLFH